MPVITGITLLLLGTVILPMALGQREDIAAPNTVFTKLLRYTAAACSIIGLATTLAALL